MLDAAPPGALISGLHEAGRRAYPEVSLPIQDLGQHLQALAATGALPPSLPAERGADLYLACACARGLPAAILAFERAYMGELPSMLAGLGLGDGDLDEVRQQTRHRLLLPGPAGAAPRIASYCGQGTLRAWLRISARRLALTLLTERGRRAAPEEALVDHAAPSLPPELDHLRGRYQEALRGAIEAAVRGLPPRQRTVLRLHFLEGIPRERIGALFQVHRTTAMRWLEEAQATILSETERRLGQALGLRPGEAQSLIGALRSELDLSMARLLRSGVTPGGGAP